MLISYQRQDLFQFVQNAIDIVRKHYFEISVFAKHGLEFNPDIEQYERMFKSGNLVVYTAEGDGQIIGYVIYFIYLHPHFKGLLTANMDMIYVEPKFRKQGLGADLIKYAEKDMKNNGVNFCILAMTFDFDFSSLAYGLDYKPMDKLFCKEF